MSQAARPMVKDGKMMLKEIVKANWMRERSSGSSSDILRFPPAQSKAAFHGDSSTLGKDYPALAMTTRRGGVAPPGSLGSADAGQSRSTKACGEGRNSQPRLE